METMTSTNVSAVFMLLFLVAITATGYDPHLAVGFLTSIGMTMLSAWSHAREN